MWASGLEASNLELRVQACPPSIQQQSLDGEFFCKNECFEHVSAKFFKMDPPKEYTDCLVDVLYHFSIQYIGCSQKLWAVLVIEYITAHTKGTKMGP